MKLSCEESIQAVKLEIGNGVQKLAKQIANLSSKLSSEFKALRTKTSSTEESIKLILQQLDEVRLEKLLFAYPGKNYSKNSEKKELKGVF